MQVYSAESCPFPVEALPEGIPLCLSASYRHGCECQIDQEQSQEVEEDD